MNYLTNLHYNPVTNPLEDVCLIMYCKKNHVPFSSDKVCIDQTITLAFQNGPHEKTRQVCSCDNFFPFSFPLELNFISEHNLDIDLNLNICKRYFSPICV